MKNWRLVYLAIPLTVLVFAGIAMKNGRTAGEEPAEGIGRVPTVQRYAAPAQEEEIPSLPAYDEYTEGESPVPVWWDPDEPMAAEWEDSLLTAKLQPSYSQLSGKFGASLGQVSEVASCQQVAEANNEAVSVDYVITSGENLQVAEAEAHAPEGIDPGGNDWNLCTERVGWDGHTAEPWELDLLSRIFYLEFWGASDICCEAGCDAILRLWESGEFGDSLGGLLSAINAAGKYVYSTYPAVWTTTYDPNGLAWCREFCEARFYAGPVWVATYFQKYGYPVWPSGSPIPCYEFDGVYFSVARG